MEDYELMYVNQGQRRRNQQEETVRYGEIGDEIVRGRFEPRRAKHHHNHAHVCQNANDGNKRPGNGCDH